MNEKELRKWTDKELAEMEKKLTDIYQTSLSELEKGFSAYMKETSEKIAPLEKAYEDAKANGDKKEAQRLGIELAKEKKLQTIGSNRYMGIAEETAARMYEVNKVAVNYLNDQMPGVYVKNYNETLKSIETDIGKITPEISFDLTDERTVRELIKKDKTLFSQKTIDKAKDKKWNLKAINSQVLQGIMQGESVDKIAERLYNVSTMNAESAIRNARTLCTTAENNGRLNGIKEAEEKGIVYEKQWMATHDERTRESHAELDGVSVPIDEEFPNGLQYPGDMAGDPGEIWNCRCTMVRKLIGFRRADGSISEADIHHQYSPHYFD